MDNIYRYLNIANLLICPAGIIGNSITYLIIAKKIRRIPPNILVQAVLVTYNIMLLSYLTTIAFHLIDNEQGTVNATHEQNPIKDCMCQCYKYKQELDGNSKATLNLSETCIEMFSQGENLTGGEEISMEERCLSVIISDTNRNSEGPSFSLNLGTILMELPNFIKEVAYFTTTWIITVMAVCRSICILKPERTTKVWHLFKLKLFIGIVVGIGFIQQVPYILNITANHVLYSDNVLRIYQIVTFLLLTCVVPVVVLIVCLVIMRRELKKQFDETGSKRTSRGYSVQLRKDSLEISDVTSVFSIFVCLFTIVHTVLCAHTLMRYTLETKKNGSENEECNILQEESSENFKHFLAFFHWFVMLCIQINASCWLVVFTVKRPIFRHHLRHLCERSNQDCVDD